MDFSNYKEGQLFIDETGNFFQLVIVQTGTTITYLLFPVKKEDVSER